MKYVSPQTEKRKQQRKKRKKQMLVAAVAAVLVVIAIVLVMFVFGGKGKDNSGGTSSSVQTEITPQPDEKPQENPTDNEESKPDKEDSKPQKDKKPKKNKTSVFAKVKSVFTKTEAMAYKYPAMAFGRSIEEEADSIISLSPMATEFILSSPSQNALVAVSSYCNKYSFEHLMTVGSPLLPDVDKIIQLAPDYVIVQTPLSDVDKVKLEQSGITVLQISAPESLDDVKEIYRSITALTHGSEIASFEAERVKASVLQKLELYRKALENTDKKDVAMVFNGYGMVATKDTFEAEILKNFFDIAINGNDYYVEDFSTVAASNPQVIIVPDYMTETDVANMGFADSEAVKNGNVYFVDIQQFETASAKTIDTLCGIANEVYGDAITVQATAEIAQ
ncbi:MAG: ABC transporter substrate-binding protein [Oscillospiraceae bacterium]|nr:ABC transporter substrate-binding protein [Oscillospiraceae bacterium]